MEIMRVLLFVGLLVHKLVWEILKRRSTTAHSTKQSTPNVMVSVIKVIKIGVLVFLLIQTLFLELLPISSDPAMIKTVGLCFYLVGLTTAILGRLHLGDNWVDLEEYQVIPEQALVTKGIYRYIRHPIYAGDLFLILGLQLALNSWLVLMAIPLFAIVFRQTSAEEIVLARAFPNYKDYCRRTKRFVPFLI
jgi:protein-S-isoprenylcysteine O-methyltransferase Ste14